MAVDGVMGHRIVRVEHFAHDRAGSHFPAQALVVRDVGLHEAHAQAPTGNRLRRQHGKAVAGQQ